MYSVVQSFVDTLRKFVAIADLNIWKEKEFNFMKKAIMKCRI